MSAVPKTHRHAEAFALMWYGCECGHRERIWNSRDGVTPFSMGCPSCGGDLRHVEWNRDQRAENHQPHYGQRVWIDLTPEKAHDYATRRVDSMHRAGHPYPPDMTRDQLIESVAKGMLETGGGGQPDGVVVGTSSVAEWRPA
jgi:hypothetical protein